MKHFFFVCIAMCLMHFHLQGQETATTSEQKSNGITFQDLSFSEALKKAGMENKLLFVDCFTTWCGPCRMLSQHVFTDSVFADYFNRHFINLKVDMEKGEGIELGKKYDVRGYPTLLFLDSNGEVVHRLIGADKASVLLHKVKLGVENGGLSGLRKRYEGGERDSTFIYEYIHILSAANQEEEAGKVATDYLEGKEPQLLESQKLFSLFFDYIHEVTSAPFQFVAEHKQEFMNRFPAYGASLDRRLLEDWIFASYRYLNLKEEDPMRGTVDEQGLNACYNGRSG